PVVALALRFEAELDLPLAAAEAGLPVPEFKKLLKGSPELARALGALVVEGGTVQRQAYLDAFPDLVRVLAPAGSAGSELRRFHGHTALVQSVACLADGRRALSGGFDKAVRLWDLATGRELRRLDGHPGFVLAVAVSPDGRRALAGLGFNPGRDYGLRLWDLE